MRQSGHLDWQCWLMASDRPRPTFCRTPIATRYGRSDRGGSHTCVEEGSSCQNDSGPGRCRRRGPAAGDLGPNQRVWKRGLGSRGQAASNLGRASPCCRQGGISTPRRSRTPSPPRRSGRHRVIPSRWRCRTPCLHRVREPHQRPSWPEATQLAIVHRLSYILRDEDHCPQRLRLPREF